MTQPVLTVQPSQVHYDGPGLIYMAEEGSTLPTPAVGTTVSGTGNTTSGSASVTSVTPTTFTNGMTVTGTGIPANTTVLSGGGTATLTLSANATATGTGVALTGTSSGSSFSNTWSSDWIPVGYTDTGISFDFNTTTVDIEAAEQLVPIDVVSTKQDVHVKFSMLQDNKFNLRVAMNGGTWTTASGVSKYSPPVLGAETRFMLAWLSQAKDEIVIAYRLFQAGSLSIARAKIGTKAVLACDFRAITPDPTVSTDIWNRWVAGTKFD